MAWFQYYLFCKIAAEIIECKFFPRYELSITLSITSLENNELSDRALSLLEFCGKPTKKKVFSHIDGNTATSAGPQPWTYTQ